MQPKDLVAYMVRLYDLKGINWGFQIKLAKSLLSKYSYPELIYALNYYKGMGESLYSLGFLSHKNNMNDPLSMYKAELNTQESGDSGERNRNRIKQNRKTFSGKDSAEYLFTAP